MFRNVFFRTAAVALLLLMVTARFALAGTGRKAGGVFEAVVHAGAPGCARSGGSGAASVGMAFASTRSGTRGAVITPGLLSGAPTVYKHESDASARFGTADLSGALHVPHNTLSTDYMVFARRISKDTAERGAIVEEADRRLAGFATPFTRPLAAWDITIQYGDGTFHPGDAPLPGRATFIYKDDDGDNVIDGTTPPIRTRTLSAWWLDEPRALWVRFPDSALDPDDKTVHAPIHRSGVFAVMGAPDHEAGGVFAFPVPWRPDGPLAGRGPGRTGTHEDGITFSNLPSQAVIRIYTLSGMLVRTLAHDGGGPQRTWDAANDAGEDVASGTYFYSVESGEASARGKLVVVR